MRISLDGRYLEEFDPMQAVKHWWEAGGDPEGPDLGHTKHLVDIVNNLFWSVHTEHKCEQISFRILFSFIPW